MNPFRSVGARLTLALALLVAGALGVVYAIVVPSLEHNLVGAKVKQLRTAAPAVGHQLPSSTASPDWPYTLATLATSANARIVVYQVLSANPLSLTVFQDSNPVSSSDVQNDPIAVKAFLNGKAATGTVTRNEARYAEAAIPLDRSGNYVMLLTAPLHDSLGNVEPRPAACARSRAFWPSSPRCCSATELRRCSRGGSGGSSGRPSGSQEATSTSRST